MIFYANSLKIYSTPPIAPPLYYKFFTLLSGLDGTADAILKSQESGREMLRRFSQRSPSRGRAVPEKRLARRLAAILVADVAGYSRLVGIDEEGTISRLRVLRRELIDPALAEHGGRLVKTMGDGLLVEFPSVVEAVRAALEVQRGMTTGNTDLPADRRIELRVGIHLGDVMIEGDDLLGDGVNVAARLEGIAEPGGIVDYLIAALREDEPPPSGRPWSAAET
jgi:class 3 adenylate cyclase